ncbi:MAG: RNA polymerase sigma-54 factor [Gemmataceae bacterium]
MRLDTSQQLRLQQKMILAPRMIQSMEILQLPILALQERIEQELQDNPVLELKTDVEETTAPAPAESDTEPELVVNEQTGEEDFGRLEDLSSEWEDYFDEGHRPSAGHAQELGEKRYELLQNVPCRPPSLYDYLDEQLRFFDAPPAVMALARLIIGNLDARGYLTVPLEDIVAQAGADATLAQAQEALRLVHKLDPPGVGARNLQECLLLQLTPDTPHLDLVRLLIERHLEDIEHNRLPVIEKRTGRSREEIRAAIAVLRTLNPAPAAHFAPPTTAYVVPDLVVERDENGNYQLRLTDDGLPEVHINRKYLEMLKQADQKTRDYLRRRLASAQWLIEAIKQRRQTLLKVAQAILARQRAFLEHGPDHIEPLKMQQIADEVGVHVTTISRAVDDKWIQTPRGVYPLRRFFTSGTIAEDGSQVAYEAIKRKLQELIAQEDKTNPLSDEELVAKLRAAGYPVARRTVAKYRKQLRIPSSRQRRDWSQTHNGRDQPQAASAQRGVESSAAPMIPAVQRAGPSGTVDPVPAVGDSSSCQPPAPAQDPS